MSYSFSIKKNKLCISLTSENKELIAQEFAKFVEKIVGVSVDESPSKSSSAESSKPIQQLTKPKTEVASVAKDETEISKISNSSKMPKTLPANFAKVLAAKSSEESNNVVEKKVSELQKTYLQMQNIIREKNLKSEIDYIVAAAYCISRYDGSVRFSEEHIKAKIAPFFDEEIDHNYILDAVDRNFIKVLPDFTGFSDTIEFELTQYGEEYFINEL